MSVHEITCGREPVGGAGSLRPCPLEAGHPGGHVSWTAMKRGGEYRLNVYDEAGETRLVLYVADEPTASRVAAAIALAEHAERTH